jgi:hypothetical protein
MGQLPTNGYQFVLASHVVEHLANPFRALSHWMRVVSEDRLLRLVIPHRDGTFDHRRDVTPLQHLFSDFEHDTPKADDTHLEEVLRLHDLSRDPGAGGQEEFLRRVRANATLRSVHHHVFDTELALRLLTAAGLEIIYVDVKEPHHICVAGEVTARSKAPGSWALTAALPDNSAWTGPDARWRRVSPFPSDRMPRS